MTDVTDPNRNVKEPEDALLTSFGAGDEEGRVVYAAGRAHCRTAVCPPVLFRSGDGGRSWDRLPAAGLTGTEIGVPPGHERNQKIFAMGQGGLQVSDDAGRSFEPAVITGLPLATGSFAISPAFQAGDPSILVGAQTLFRYSDRTATLEPYVGTLTGPFEPAFSPDYLRDGLFLLGGMRPDGAGTLRGAVYVCQANACTYSLLPRRNQIPKVRAAAGPGTTTSLYAFTENHLFASTWPHLRFEKLPRPGPEASLTDLEVSPDGATLIATLANVDPSARDAGVYLSRDGGRTWRLSRGDVLTEGALKVAALKGRTFVALKDGGLACSSDGGRSFQRRCRP